MFEKKELGQAREMIDSLIQITPEVPAKWNEIDFAQKLDRLSELIDVLRFETGYPEEKDPRRTFRPNGIFADDSAGKIHFVKHGPTESLEIDASKKLMLPLLDYLHAHPGKGRSVLSIIRAFIRDYFPKCRLRDFQLTATGVLRIETNVMFAAHELRKIGLLQFTQTEAFKTWRLSVLGILAAENASVRRPDPGEKVPSWFWLHIILSRLEPLRTMGQLISRLENIAKSLSINWSEKQGFLALTMQTIAQYQQILSPMEKSNRHGRAREAEKLLIKLNESPEAEFVVCAFDGVPAEQLNLILAKKSYKPRNQTGRR